MDINNIIETYGEEILEINEIDKNNIYKNISFIQIYRKYDKELITEIVEKYFPIFLYDENEFKEKVIKIFKSYKYEEDLNYLEELL